MKFVTLKLGNMRKPQDFTVYPQAKGVEGQSEITFQSDSRIAQINTTTGAGVLSDGKGGHQGFAKLIKVLGAKDITVSQEVIQQLKDAQPKSGQQIGAGVFIA